MFTSSRYYASILERGILNDGACVLRTLKANMDICLQFTIDTASTKFFQRCCVSHKTMF